MQIVLSENDLANAIKLYLAHSGVIRTVVDLEFARKLKGDDAGISVALELSDQDLSTEELQKLAMEQNRARGLNARVTNQTSPAFDAPEKTTPQTASESPAPQSDATDPSGFDDDQIPFGAEEPGDTPPAPKATPEELGAGNAQAPAEEMPEASPFADQAEQTSEDEAAAEIATEIAADVYVAPDTDESNPFADAAPVVPAGEEVAAEEVSAPTETAENLFG